MIDMPGPFGLTPIEPDDASRNGPDQPDGHGAPPTQGASHLDILDSDRPATSGVESGNDEPTPESTPDTVGPVGSHVHRSGKRLTASETDFDVVRQRAFIVALAARGTDDAAIDESLDELALLIDTAGADVVGRSVQRRASPDPATFIGPGKVEEIAFATQELDVDLVVFDDELSPAQTRNLEHAFKTDVVDRSAVILDIFAQHATSRAGMLQVELAQLRYLLPRLRGKGAQMSRLEGRIGTRGPGESKLEVDRRRILRRITRLEGDIRSLERVRATQRKARERSRVPTVALIGYTNAGKSSLLNRMTGADVLTENRLFSTLDPTVRRLEVDGVGVVLLADTVGFVRKLPHQLVAAFRSTLEVVKEADVLVHVVDGSSLHAAHHIAAVDAVLGDLETGDQPRLIVANKSDRATPMSRAALELEMAERVIWVSALTGDGIPALRTRIIDLVRQLRPAEDFWIPWTRGDVLASLHRDGEVLVAVHEEDGARIQARLAEDAASRYREFRVAGSGERPSGT